MSEQRATIREQLARAIGWHDAHTDFDAAVRDLPPALRGARPPGLPHSSWELVEHIRLAQRDLLDFCTSPDYTEPSWPADYWPASVAPPSEDAWNESIARVRSDRRELQALAERGAPALDAPVPNGNGQSYLRELLLALDHTAYHVGQLVAVRQALGAWPAA